MGRSNTVGAYTMMATQSGTPKHQHRLGDKWRKWGDASCRIYITREINHLGVWIEADWHDSFKGIKIGATWNPWDFVRVAEC